MPVLAYAAALFLSAFLLFWVQPLFAKMALPLLGGSPAVWTTALMFFEVMLLAGYGYAHLLARLRSAGAQILIHLAVLAAGLASLPLHIAPDAAPPAESSPLLWLLGLLAGGVGAPFFALSASAPLFQSWFARGGRDPYFLYAASNLGSLAALLAFPFLLEPNLTLSRESRLWGAAYGGLIALTAVCGWLARRSGAPSPTARADVGWRERAVWVALAAVPASLLLGVTAYVTTDVASAPLFWVVPLALYLLTFIIAFARGGRVLRPWLVKAQGLALVTLAILLVMGLLFDLGEPLLLAAFFHLGAFFLMALLFHAELARRRPAAGALTAFYFCLALGGALGGLFNAVAAPLLFSSIYEYYLALVAACALRALIGGGRWSIRPRDLILPLCLAAAIGFAAWEWRGNGTVALVARDGVLIAAALLLVSFTERPLRLALGIGGVIAIAVAAQGTLGLLLETRSFFGVNRIKLLDEGRRMTLVHGTTIHGAEATDPRYRREPLTYYGSTSPVGQLFAARADWGRVGIVGLGAGSLACYRKPGEAWRFFEIDAVVARLARDERYFHFLGDCAPEVPIIFGDGRLSLAKEPDGGLDLLILDAFSSDAIPLHLLTREALALYLRKLGEGGVLLLHVSNRNLSLAPVAAALAADAGLAALDQLYQPSAAETAAGMLPSEWIALARRPEDLAVLEAGGRWHSLAAKPGAQPWTDDFSNLLAAIRW